MKRIYYLLFFNNNQNYCSEEKNRYSNDNDVIYNDSSSKEKKKFNLNLQKIFDEADQDQSSDQISNESFVTNNTQKKAESKEKEEVYYFYDKKNINLHLELTYCKQKIINMLNNKNLPEEITAQLITEFENIYGKLINKIEEFFLEYENIKKIIYSGRMSENSEQQDPLEKKDENLVKKEKILHKLLKIIKETKLGFNNTKNSNSNNNEYNIKYDLSMSIDKILDLIDNNINIKSTYETIIDLFFTDLLIYQQVLNIYSRYGKFTYEIEYYINNDNSTNNSFLQLKKKIHNFIAEYNFKRNKIFPLYISLVREYLHLRNELDNLRIKDPNSLKEKLEQKYVLYTDLYLKPRKYDLTSNLENINVPIFNLEEPQLFIGLLFIKNNEIITNYVNEFVQKYFFLLPSDKYHMIIQENIYKILLEFILYYYERDHTIEDNKISLFMVNLFTKINNIIGESLNLNNIIKYKWYLKKTLEIFKDFYQYLYYFYDKNRSFISNIDVNDQIKITEKFNKHIKFFQNYTEDLKAANSIIDTSKIPIKLEYTFIDLFLILKYGENNNGFVEFFFTDSAISNNNNIVLSTYYERIKKHIQEQVKICLDDYSYNQLLEGCIDYYQIISILDILIIYNSSIKYFYDQLPSFMKITLNILSNNESMNFWAKILKNIDANISFLNIQENKLSDEYHIDTTEYHKDKDGKILKKNKNKIIQPIFNTDILSHIKDQAQLEKFNYYVYYILSIILNNLNVDFVENFQYIPKIVFLNILFDCAHFIINNNLNKKDNIYMIFEIFEKFTFYDEKSIPILNIFSKILCKYYETSEIFTYKNLLYMYNLYIIENTESNILPILPHYIDRVSKNSNVLIFFIKLFGVNPNNINPINELQKNIELKKTKKEYPLIMNQDIIESINEDNKELDLKEEDLLKKIILIFKILKDYIEILKSFFDTKNSKNLDYFDNQFIKNANVNTQYDKIEEINMMLNKGILLLISDLVNSLNIYYSNKQNENINNPLVENLKKILSAEILDNDKVKIKKNDLEIHNNKNTIIIEIQKYIASNNNTEYIYITYKEYLDFLKKYIKTCEKYEEDEEKEKKRKYREELELQSINNSMTNNSMTNNSMINNSITKEKIEEQEPSLFNDEISSIRSKNLSEIKNPLYARTQALRNQLKKNTNNNINNIPQYIERI